MSILKLKKQKEKPMRFDKDTEYYLVNIKENTYDPHLIKGWDNAVHLNMAYQIGSGEENVVPMSKEWVAKNKLKERKFL